LIISKILKLWIVGVSSATPAYWSLSKHSTSPPLRFRSDFAAACCAAGVMGSPHGVRKIAATRQPRTVRRVAELEAIFTWTGGKMASLYARSADKRRLAKRAMRKLAEQK
jgi:hypothetical protein